MADQQKTAIITGCNVGIGFETTKILSKKNYEIIMACRTESKALEAIQTIKKDNPDAKLIFMQLDLSSLKSINNFAENFLAMGKPLHVLVNNAGFSYDFKDKTLKKTEDGFESTVGTNHLGHFLLTHLLLDTLKETATASGGEARIAVLASMLHDSKANKRLVVHPTDFEDMNFENHPENYNGVQAYKNSKLCNVMFTYELARQLEGTGVTVNCMCPGFIPTTGFMRNASTITKVAVSVVKFFKPSITRTTLEGATDVAMLASSPEMKGVTGKYFTYGKVTESSPESRNEENQKKLWKISEQLLKINSEEGERL